MKYPGKKTHIAHIASKSIASSCENRNLEKKYVTLGPNRLSTRVKKNWTNSYEKECTEIDEHIECK